MRNSPVISPAPMKNTAAKVLYLAYDGMCDPLGGSQVLPYLRGLAERGYRISLMSFEKPERSEEERAAVERMCREAGIDWHPLPYHKSPPLLSSMYDVRQMRRLAARLHRKRSFDLVHCRSYLPALVGLKMKRRFGMPFIFDMRGFWADERRDSRAWKVSNPLFGAVYRYFKRREREFWAQADHVVSLTHEAAAVLESERSRRAHVAPVTVIPCCVEFGVFPPIDVAARRHARVRLDIGPDERVLAYIGSLGGNYMLGEMLDFFKVYRRRHGGTKFLFVTHVPERTIRNAVNEHGLDQQEIVVRAARRDEVPRLMAAADLGIAFKQPSFSAKACSPTKLGEMLALELPVVVNDGVGDVARVVEDCGAGAVVSGFDDEAYRAALDALDNLEPDMERWRSAARRWFDLETGVERYAAIYLSLVPGKSPDRR
jgi:glycosyltransferase involved in cell wall biosynthesis